jgi:hypothetical protein
VAEHEDRRGSVARLDPPLQQGQRLALQPVHALVAFAVRHHRIITSLLEQQ